MLTVNEAKEYGWGEKAQAFATWHNEVDAAVAKLSGGWFGVDDLPDWDFASAFDAGQDPTDAADEILAENGFDQDTMEELLS
ncbi:MAG: hypothetical protein ACYSWP_12865 [Planctomycetota bacterium]|jgi:hypothetical protein